MLIIVKIYRNIDTVVNICYNYLMWFIMKKNRNKILITILVITIILLILCVIYVMYQISASKNSEDSWLENISIKEAMKKLNDREKLILTLRFFNGRTQMEVADEIGISQAQVSRLEKTALKHMRKYV